MAKTLTQTSMALIALRKGESGFMEPPVGMPSVMRAFLFSIPCMGIRRGGKVPDQAGSSRTATKRIGEPVKPASFKGRAVQ